jgi:hypothetical protein
MPKTIAVMYKPLPDERGFGVVPLVGGAALSVVSSCKGLASFIMGQPFWDKKRNIWFRYECIECRDILA